MLQEQRYVQQPPGPEAIPPIWMVIAAAGLAVVLAMLVSHHREFDSSDEGYLVYSAWAALGPAPADAAPSRHWLKNDGYILGLPFLFNQEFVIQDLRLYSAALWLLVHTCWFLMAARYLNVSPRWALLMLPICMYVFQFAVVNYQTLPLAAGLLSASLLLGGLLRSPPFHQITYGILHGFFLMVMAIAYTANFTTALFLVIVTSMLIGSRPFSRGIWTGFAIGLVLWAYILPLEMLFDGVELNTTSDLESFGGISGIISTRGPRFFFTLFYIGGSLLAGYGLLRLMSKLDKRGIHQTAQRVAGWTVAIVVLFVFLFAWFAGLRAQSTLIGYLSLGVFALLPAGWILWRSTEKPPAVFLLLVLHLIPPVMVTCIFGTVKFVYYLGYAGPAVFGLLFLLSRRCHSSDTVIQRWIPWRTAATVLVIATIVITLTLSNRGETVLGPGRKWTEPGLLHGLKLSDRSTRNYEELLALYPELDLQNSFVVSADYAPIVYAIWNRACPFPYAWNIVDEPYDRAWLVNPTNRPMALVFRPDERTSHYGPDPRDWLRYYDFSEEEVGEAKMYPTTSGDFMVITIPSKVVKSANN